MGRRLFVPVLSQTLLLSVPRISAESSCIAFYIGGMLAVMWGGGEGSLSTISYIGKQAPLSRSLG